MPRIGNLRFLSFYPNRPGGATRHPRETRCLLRRRTAKMSLPHPASGLDGLPRLSSPLSTAPMSLEVVRLDRRFRSNRREAGFTLLELLVVLAILGLLIGLVAPRVLGILGTAKEKIAQQSIQRLETVLDIYKLDVGNSPTTEQGLQALLTRPPDVAHWNGPYLKGNTVPEDPWGHPFVYRSPSERQGYDYDLYSLGPSGRPGGSGKDAPIYNE